MQTNKTKGGIITSSFRSPEGEIGELIFDAKEEATAFVVFQHGRVTEHATWERGAKPPLVPISPANNLLRHHAVLLPQAASPHGSLQNLLDNIGLYIDRYVDLTPAFREVAIHYVLLTWVYDAFNELPYLRFRGEPGSGKTRALMVIGSLCYQAFLASGASTVSPIFHTLDMFRGTFIFDEADFRFSDEKLELVKILNNGNVRGFPVFRSVLGQKKQFEPEAFHVFGPKIVAMRHSYQDRALESRFLTEEMGQRPLRHDVPLNLPDYQKEEAQVLRNQLLSYRFEYLERTSLKPELASRGLSSRMNQILLPLLSVAESDEAKRAILSIAKETSAREQSERSELPEAMLLGVILELFKESRGIAVTLQSITSRFVEKHGTDFERPITNRYMGSLIRKRLHLLPYKSRGIYRLSSGERAKALALAERFGLTG